ncbi:MAG: alanine racemase [Polyangiaceae bacterium]|nr:alanine racemase [Polyangiaceae bacterium]
MDPDDRARYARYCRALRGERLPAAIVDLEALEMNVDRLVAPIRAAGKALRIATKSIRCPDLVDRLLERTRGTAIGLMTYTAAETAMLAARGHRDLLLAYPTLAAHDLDAMAAANRVAHAALVVDCIEHVGALAAAAERAGTTVPAVIDVDMSYRPLAHGPHLGVRRSPLRTPEAVVALAEQIRARKGLRFDGLLGYEAQIAGVGDAARSAFAANAVKRAIKARSAPGVRSLRRACLDALVAHGLAPALVNGGGTGSVAWSAEDQTLTEVTVGSGFLGPGLFDDYRGLSLAPAAGFALEVTRRPAGDIYTCSGGGYVASGSPGGDRLPRPWLPPGMTLLSIEGAGEVQTPVRSREPLALGAPALFRHAKAGELAEHFNEYVLVRGDGVVARAKTYRGLGHAFLG